MSYGRNFRGGIIDCSKKAAMQTEKSVMAVFLFKSICLLFLFKQGIGPGLFTFKQPPDFPVGLCHCHFAAAFLALSDAVV